jgi:hypothetical protein
MIHRFLIFDRKFNCRLDRSYPVQPVNIAAKENLSPAAATAGGNENVPAAESETALEGKDTWQRVVVHRPRFQPDGFDPETFSFDSDEDSAAELATALASQLRLEHGNAVAKEDALRSKHAQQLLLGLTHSLRNMLLKLAPRTDNANSLNVGAMPNLTANGYAFNFKASKYRLFYFESPSGWRFLMLTDVAGVTVSSTLAPETVLKRWYEGVFCEFVCRYPLGFVHLNEEADRGSGAPLSAASLGTSARRCMFSRPGFLARLDEFLQSVSGCFP